MDLEIKQKKKRIIKQEISQNIKQEMEQKMKENTNKKKALIAMSGGIDSSVAVYLFNEKCGI